MILIACDLLTTLFQAFSFVYVCNNIAYKENKLPKSKVALLIALIFAEIAGLTYSGINVPMASFIMFVIFLFLCLMFYRKSVLDAFIGVGFTYLIIAIQSYFVLTFYHKVLIKVNLQIPSEVQMLMFIFIPVWISYCFIYRFRKYFLNAAIYLKELKHSQIFILVIDFALIFMDTLRMEWTSSDMGVIFKSILYAVAFAVFVFVVVYFAKINDKSKEVEMLNAALSEKITELKKVKHDYGSEISGLYGLYQLGKMDRVGAMLKSIVDRNQAMNTGVNVSVEATALVASVLQPAVSAGIDVIAFDSAEYENLAINDNELLKLLCNIVKNSIDVLGNVQNPMIKFKSYNSYNGIIITIENNGPEIPKEIKNKIFQTGFSTKENGNGDRGYGLSIVKEIIDKCNGDISVNSNNKWTEFKMEIPCKVS